MPSLPRPPSPRYYFNKVPEVSIKEGSQGKAGQLHGCSPALPRGSGQPGGVAAIKVGAERRTRMFPLAPEGTDPDPCPSRLQTWPCCWGAGPRGGQNGLGGCAGGSLALPSHVSLPLCRPALRGRRCWLPSLPDFCFSTMQNRQQTAPELQSLAQRRGLCPRLDAAVAGRRSVGPARAVPCSAFPTKGMGSDQGPCLWQGDRVTLQFTLWGWGGAEQHPVSHLGWVSP